MIRNYIVTGFYLVVKVVFRGVGVVLKALVWVCRKRFLGLCGKLGGNVVFVWFDVSL